MRAEAILPHRMGVYGLERYGLDIFAAQVRLHHLNTDGSGVIRIFRTSRVAVYIVAALGFGITLFSTVISAVPTKDIESKGLFLLKVIGGAVFLLGAGLTVYFSKKKDRIRAGT
jgi:hypothetical protein